MTLFENTTPLVICAVLLVANGGCKSRGVDDGACTPEGGLACSDNELQICDGGTLKGVAQCPGGCEDESGVVRCKANNGAAMAPPGAVCREGVTLCGIGLEVPALLTCRGGRMEKAATCPTGCIDEGESGGLFCLGPKGGLRFHIGFQCPGFQKGEPEYACGPEGKHLLRCEAGRLVEVAERACHRCYQSQATGTVRCENEDGSLLDLRTGSVIAPLESAKGTAATRERSRSQGDDGTKDAAAASLTQPAE